MKNRLRNMLTPFAAACILWLPASATTGEETDFQQVIPRPLSVTSLPGGTFTLRSGMTVSYPKGNKAMARNATFLTEYVQTQTGVKLMPIKGRTEKSGIRLTLGLDNPNREAYIITVNERGIGIQGASEAGVFYGIQALRKALPATATEKISVPYAVVTDQPRFAYRGSMLDCSRHFFPVDFIKKYIDLLAMHNINTFHWHITDDQGWRFEVKKYPQLAKDGSRREQTVIGHNTGRFDGKPYEPGFYTQKECRDIVAYADERHVTVIPEIDMPGHMLAALSVRPDLGCTGGPYKVGQQWGVYDDVLCAGNPQTVEFIRDVLGELIGVFPSTYIHVGGDECPKTRWKSCPRCQARAQELGFTSAGRHSVEEQLQSYLIHEAEAFLNKHGRNMIGWDETLEGGLAPNATVMSWRGFEGGMEAARQHHKVIMTPTSHCYFDYYQTQNLQNEPLSIGGFVPLSKVYTLEPVPDILSEEEKGYIIGAQANLWTEYVLTPEHVEYMLLPRLSAMCEVQWTHPTAKDYKNFRNRLSRMKELYSRYGYNCAPHME